MDISVKKIALAAIAALAVQFPAIAGQPFRYTSKCYVLKNEDQCVIIETRDTSGALRSRNIFSNKAGLTIKMRWNGQKFVQTDSYNKFEYTWEYKVNPEVVEDGITGTVVMPGVTVVNISWD